MGDHPEIGPRTAEHLEKLFADAYKREIDQEENVPRTLPFFATALGTILATIGLTRSSLPPIEDGVWGPVILALMCTSLAATIAVVVMIWCATRQQEYPTPARETSLLEFANDTAAYCVATGVDQPDQSPLMYLRRTVLVQLATATEASRRNNLRRGNFRFLAFQCLTVGLLSTILGLSLILVNGTLNGGSNGTAHAGSDERGASSGSERPVRPDAETSPGTPADAGLQQGNVGRVGSEAEDGPDRDAALGR
jgi:hypothetical protein